MSTKENNLKEKFKIALTSTAKVIADDLDIKKTYLAIHPLDHFILLLKRLDTNP